MRLWWTEPDGSRPELEPRQPGSARLRREPDQPVLQRRGHVRKRKLVRSAAGELRSFVYVCLRAERPFGLLVLASPDADRFTRDMGILYLTRLGELVSMALRRHAG